MGLIKKCLACGIYTMKENCPKDNSVTIEAHYKFVKIRDAPKEFKR